MMNPLKKFTTPNVSKRLNKINAKVCLSHQEPFPKRNLLSHYQFKKRFIEIFQNGDIQGGYVRMVTSLIDFSFIRSLVAHRYSKYGTPCYDPVSLFLLDLFRYIDSFHCMSHFLTVVRDKDRGRAYRTYAGLSPERIPGESTFSEFRMHLGDELYNEIFHVLVSIFHQLEMISFRVLTHDGTLYPTWARYKGCTYFCDQCQSITVHDALQRAKNQILYRLNNLANNNLGRECRVRVECPSNKFPEHVKKSNIELFSFRLAFADGELSEEQQNTAILFGVAQELARQNLCINTIRSNISHINFDDGSVTMCCPKLPKDTDARIGVRRDPQNSSKKQKIFGYNAVLSTSVELHLKLELPVAVSNIAGNADEGALLIKNKAQILSHHHCESKIDIADAKYDSVDNYDYIREHDSIPIIDYNPRRENLSKEALIERGYDQNGWPFAPCGLLTRPNGFDQKHQRLSFCCFKQCTKLKYKALEELQSRYNIAACPHIVNQTGYACHMSIKDHPRLINEIPRGSHRYNSIKKARSASERINSGAKENLKALDTPRVIGLKRATIMAHMVTMALLITRAFSFIIRTTVRFRLFGNSTDPALRKKLDPPIVPQSIRSIIKLE